MLYNYKFNNKHAGLCCGMYVGDKSEIFTIRHGLIYQFTVNAYSFA